LNIVTSCRTLLTDKMSYAGKWLVCAVCDGHCWDDYSAVYCRMTVVLAVELMH